jgi:hypothetical protein
VKNTAPERRRKQRERALNITSEAFVAAEDEGILNMTKALTVAQLNMMFSDRVDVFEFPQERDDWKFPRYVALPKKGKRKKASDEDTDEG